MIDTHTHLNHPDFTDDWEMILDRAQQADVNPLINVGYDLASSVRAVKQSEQSNGMVAAVGIHPHEASNHDETDLLAIGELCKRHPEIVAIGEIGLDFYRNLSPLHDQRQMFEDQLTLSQELILPVILHVRQAQSEAQKIVGKTSFASKPGVCHCFDGDVSDASNWLDLGFLIGITGLVTYKRSDNIRSVVSRIPKEHLLIETDCPYLTPVPHRGKRNEPANVHYVLEAIAEVRGENPEMLREQTSENAKRLFFNKDLET